MNKPVLSEDEKVILRNVDDDICKYIVRNKNGNLFLYEIKPIKNRVRHSWQVLSVSAVLGLVMFNHLFQFIKW